MLYLLSPTSLPSEFLERARLHEGFGLLQDVAATAEVDDSAIVHVDPMVRVEQPLHLDVVASVERRHPLHLDRPRGISACQLAQSSATVTATLLVGADLDFSVVTDSQTPAVEGVKGYQCPQVGRAGRCRRSTRPRLRR